ncbi:HEAT repeat domain-containing protein [Streptomyces sp. NPDC021080]|uniref:HEAT repeat domain-containing protein n=1 Tax=Streptomyces sp. NPDC021080 TaxID=3365110 RepID=UPI0037B62E71
MIDMEPGLLEGLDEVDWAELGHAYGRAVDVPGQLTALCGPDATARESALMSLFGNIFHQGTRYSASPYAVPFLARIALAGPQSIRDGVLRLLTRLAIDWHDEYDLPRGIDIKAWRAAAAELTMDEALAWYDERIAAEPDKEKRGRLGEIRAEWAAGRLMGSRESALRSYDAVRAQLPALLPLLDDPEPAVRSAAAYLTAWFPEEAPAVLPCLLHRLRVEDSVAVRATALVAVGLLGDAALVPRLSPELDATEPLIRWAAATALARIGSTDGTAGLGPDLARAVIGELAAAAVRTPEPGIYYNEEDIPGYTGRSLLALADHDRETVIGGVADCLAGIRSRDHLDATARDALTVFFAGPAHDGRPCCTPLTELTEGQRRLLRALVKNGPWGRYGKQFEKCLTDRRLPDTRAGLRVYVGLPDDGLGGTEDEENIWG